MLFFNFSIVSHVVTICTFGPILVDLLELFFGPSNHCHELWLKETEPKGTRHKGQFKKESPKGTKTQKEP